MHWQIEKETRSPTSPQQHPDHNRYDHRARFYGIQHLLNFRCQKSVSASQLVSITVTIC